MSEKRFECVFVEDEEFGGHFRRLKDNTTNIVFMVCDVVDLLNFQDTQVKILKEENEQLRNSYEIEKKDAYYYSRKMKELAKENELLQKQLDLAEYQLKVQDRILQEYEEE